jgi:TolB-like protein/DNA-binding winged helix-turn-helix (wHTH) protein/tetratricopeptide (TPR) repeat protein
MTNEISGLRSQAPIDLAREPNFALGPVEVRPSTRELRLGARSEVLEPRVMQVLVALKRADGEIVTRDGLITVCWEGRIVSEDAINRVISRLRRAGEWAGGAFSIETVTKVGYRLVIGQADNAQPQPTAFSGAVAFVRSHAVVFALSAAALVLAALAWSAYAPRQAPALSIAVLPFEPFYVDTDAQYVGDGLASAIADGLAEVGMPMVSRTESFAFRGDERANAAARLGATHIVVGEVRRDGEALRVDVRVEDASEGVTILVREFEGALSDVPALRDQISADIVGVLLASPLGLDGGITSERSVPRAEIIASLMRIREQNDAEDRLAGYETARALARAAPREAIALNSLANQTAIAMRAIPREDRAAALVAARAAARRAERLERNSASVHLSQGFLTPTTMWAEREAHFRRAIELDPSSPSAPHVLGVTWRQSGRLHEAAEQIATANARTPLMPYFVSEHIDVLLALGRQAEAEALLERARRLWPTHRAIVFTVFDAALTDGALADAEAMLANPVQRAIIAPIGGPQTVPILVRALRTRSGADVAVALRACGDYATLTRNASRNCLIGLNVLGELDEAFALAAFMYPDQRGPTRAAREQIWLDASDTLQGTAVLFLAQTAPLRADPRFIGVAERIGLLEYWHEVRPPDFCATERAPVCERLAR